MTNAEKYEIESFGRINDAEQLKALQADMRRLPNFGGKAFVADGCITRDYWALVKDRVTGELAAYFGTQRGFAVWGKEPVRPEDERAIKSHGGLGFNPASGKPWTM